MKIASPPANAISHNGTRRLVSAIMYNLIKLKGYAVNSLVKEITRE